MTYFPQFGAQAFASAQTGFSPFNNGNQFGFPQQGGCQSGGYGGGGRNPVLRQLREQLLMSGLPPQVVRQKMQALKQIIGGTPYGQANGPQSGSGCPVCQANQQGGYQSPFGQNSFMS